MDDVQPDASLPDDPESAERDPHALMPGAQGSAVPLGWKPSMQKPVPVVRCVVIKKNGKRCGRWSMRGMTKCYAHGKNTLNFPNVTAHRDAIIEAARMRLLDDADLAVGTLEQLMQPGTNEGIRLKAATEVLDRVGVRGGFEVEVEVQSVESPAEVIANRLKTLRERGKAALEAGYGAVEQPDDEVLDAEVVADSDDEQSDD